MAITILEGSTFCICDDVGDVGTWATSGLFAEDTRFLSVLKLTVDGKRPLLLTSDKVDYFSAAFYLRNPPTDHLGPDEVSITRERFIGEAMQDRIVVQNQGMRPVSLSLGVEVGCDFADIFAVKDYDFALGDPQHAEPLPPLVECRYDSENNQFLLADETGVPAQTQVIMSRAGEIDGCVVTYRIELEPRDRWDLRLDIVPLPDGQQVVPRVAERRFGDELARVRESLAAWQLRVPQLRATWDDLAHSFGRSVSDLASLRMHGREDGVGKLPAAGMPWFMTVFGRDTLITCLQTLLFGPELAVTALEVLGDLQATDDDPGRDAEPGKIVHELRRGKAARNWHGTYYGTVDATPLYLILLSEVWRWTDDTELVESLKGHALQALEWIDKRGDLDGDGFVEYRRRSPRGLDNQSWKDSHDSQRFADGRIAEPPIAPCEVQGYVYDAKRRAAELAREVWRDRELADRLEREAAELRDRFNEAFWTEERGGYYVLALDGDKSQVDSLCSNVGHLLWSEIVPTDRVDAIVDALMSDALWSGWGIRTMSTLDRAYNPLAYHNGTVWPHDNSLCAWGMAKYGRWPEAHRIVRQMLTAGRHFDYQLPEVFAGMPRTETRFPIAYPTAARPQAWAAGTPVLLLQLLLGLQPDRRQHALATTAPAELPSWAGSIRLSSVRAFDRLWEVRLEEGEAKVHAG
ncbi:MAG TPA: glycogen debranching N-terminal domain-containing protein [Gaiellaceae bacterium]|nr:glycogen debranching N-terminal domain-containing protein [Gaiellaceae bacterium]